MAIWNENYYKGEDVYSDGIVEDEILNYVQNGKEDLETFIGNDYAKAYHLLPIRENILNWYPFGKEQSALEIGAGCGAITGALCKKLGKVVSVDLSQKRSKINYERHKDFQNLTIMIGNLNDMHFEELFDYIILNGVLEYAISFTEGKKPYHTFLKNISKFLKPNGKLLIAIENKLGLKYFNGAKEDHTGNFFVGLNGYVNNHTVRTFGKQEIKIILDELGYVHTKFYYPYPDYKFPNEIFTDESIQSYQYGRQYLNCEDGRYYLFDEYEVGRSLLNEGVRDIFANSFLIETSKCEISTDILYAKLNSDRREKLRIGTTILNEGKVLKFPLNVEASEHINRMENCINNWKGQGVHFLKGERIGDSICYEYLQEKNIDAQIVELIQEEKKDEILAILEDFYVCYKNEFKDAEVIEDFYSLNFVNLFGNRKLGNAQLCVRNVNIDIILDNIFRIKDNYLMIDGEWIYDEWIPYGFVVWRSINELFCKHKQLEQLISKEYIYDLFGIVKSDIEVYYDWAIHFAVIYVGNKQLQQIEKSITPFSLDQEYQRRMSESRVTMSLYIDRGEGFAEETKLYQTIQLVDNHFEIRFVLDDIGQIKALRFDPVEKMVCSCDILEISDLCEIISNNSGEEIEQMNYFYNGDPQYLIQLRNCQEENIDKSYEICIKGVLNVLKDEQLTPIVFKFEEWKNQSVRNIKELELNNSKLGADNQGLHENIRILELKNKELEGCNQNLQVQIEQLNIDKEKISGNLKGCEEERDFYKIENQKNEYLVNNTKAYIKKKVEEKWKKIRRL